jgi:hypothetical protein
LYPYASAFRRARLQHVYSILGGKNLETGRVSVEQRDSQFAVLATAQERVLDLRTSTSSSNACAPQTFEATR